MIIDRKRLAKGTMVDAVTVNKVVYTVPALMDYTIPTGLWLCNLTADDVTVNVLVAGTFVIKDFTIPGNASLPISLKEANIILHTGELIEAFASAASAVTYYLSGGEVDV